MIERFSQWTIRYSQFRLFALVHQGQVEEVRNLLRKWSLHGLGNACLICSLAKIPKTQMEERFQFAMKASLRLSLVRADFFLALTNDFEDRFGYVTINLIDDLILKEAQHRQSKRP